MRDSGPRGFVEIGPEVAERMPLEREPSAATVASYVLTRGASRAWEAINNQLTGAQGALFWIGGSAGAGKTHFLNYVLALSARAGALSAETARYITLPIEVSGGVRDAEIDRRILESIAVALTDDDHAPALWRQMRGAEALTIAFDGARRQGVKGITIAIDLGLDETAPALEFLSALAQVGRSIKNLRLIVVAAGRGAGPAVARVFNVTPHADEEIAVAVGRARRLDDSALRTVDGLYRNLDEVSGDPRAIYPLHPAAAGALRSLYAPNGAVGVLAKAVREVIEPWHGDQDFQRLIMPAALMRSAAVRRAVDARLGEAGRAALKIANVAAAAGATEDAPRATIQALVDTLVLIHLGGAPAMLPLVEIRARMDLDGHNGAGGAGLAEWLTMLAGRTRGVIIHDAQAQTAGFNPRGAGAPAVAGFNSALALVRHFDPSVTAARELPELKAILERLSEALAAALEGACRNRETLAAAMRESNAQLSPAQQQAFAGFIDLAEGGAAALIEVGGDQPRREAAIAAIAAYEALATVAESIPRLRIMREYLAATRLPLGNSEDAGRNRDLVALDTECQMLAVALHPGVLAGAGRNLDALEARFQKFKWTYVQQYRAAHDQCRFELERLAPVVADAHRHLEALRRLNAIAALGAAAGSELAADMIALDHRLAPCDFEGALAPEVTPCCPRCGYLLGTLLPREAMQDLCERARRALQAKLAALAQSAISRLIRQNDSNHRLEGFLKIVQAAQTEALIRVLDDELARYLTMLLDENVNAGNADAIESPGHATRQTLRAPRSRRTKMDGRNGRNGRAPKAPPDASH